ncbi:MAG: universal stress protein [Amnibacterium sp.]
MFDRVVVGWNGTSAADSALDWALQRPGLRHLVLVRVVEDGAAPAHSAAAVARATARAAVDHVADRLRIEHPVLTIDAVLEDGRAEEVLRRWAARGSLLVLGMADREGIGRVLATDAPGPVALIPEGASRRHGEVVVAIDGFVASAAAAEIAAGEAVDRQAAVVAVHVSRDPLQGRPRFDPVRGTGLGTRFPHLLIRERLVRGDPALELARAGAQGSVLVLGRDDAERPLLTALLGRVHVPTIVVGPADAIAPAPVAG